MTWVYSTWFSTLWCVSILAIPGTIVLLVYSITWAVPHAHNSTLPDDLDAHEIRYSIGFLFTVLLAYFALYTRYWPRVKHQIRAGVFPFSFCDPMPVTEDEFIRACGEAHAKGKLTVVSHAWSFYLAKTRATGRRVWTLKYVGQKANGRWKSGTALIQVKKELAAQDPSMTLSHSPTMEFASLGSWIATIAHGHPGTETTGDIFNWLTSARVLHVASKKITDDGPVELLQKFGTRALEGQYVVLDVDINPVPNVRVVRGARVIEGVDDCEYWLAGTHVRIMFIGYFGALGFVWNRSDDIDGLHEHPQLCAPFCFWLTVDAFATIPCAWIGNLRRFDGYATLANANGSINPPFYPIFSVWGQICCIYNCEIYVPMTPTATQLLAIVEDIRALHRKIGGRTEMRLDNHTVYFDMSFSSVANFTKYFTMLYQSHGVRSAAQHPGKFRMDSMAPLKEIGVAAAHRPVKSV